MAKQKKIVKTAKKAVYGQLYQIGKMKFLIRDCDEDGYMVYRLVRGKWTFVEQTETESGAYYWVLHSVAKVSDCTTPMRETPSIPGF